jgi:hypothetical protein
MAVIELKRLKVISHINFHIPVTNLDRLHQDHYSLIKRLITDFI